MCLSQIKKGQVVSIARIKDDSVRTQFIRFGMSEGSRIKCLEKIPFGPLLMLHNRQEIAIGREVAKTIFVHGG